jgi:hypothetical protein
VKGKRTGIDFSKHEVRITESDGLLIHYIKKPGTINDSIKYINTNGIMAVTGDYGNWIFCREFHPSKEGGVSDGYWEEKLCIASTQEPKEFDPEATEKELKRLLSKGLKEYGYTGDMLKKMQEYCRECLRYVGEDQWSYKKVAYDECPSDYEAVVYIKKTKYWLLAVFDGFDEICRRMKENELVNEKQLTT